VGLYYNYTTITFTVTGHINSVQKLLLLGAYYKENSMRDPIITQHKHEKPCGPVKGRVDLNIGRAIRESGTFLSEEAMKKLYAKGATQ
jgi:hypothetical protein